MALSLEEQNTKGRQSDQYINATTGEAVTASPGISPEVARVQAAALLKDRAKTLYTEIDRIKDQDWVSETLFHTGYNLDPEDEKRRFYSTADRKFEDTSVGGNYVCNPRPGFTPYADPPKPGLVSGRNTLSPLSYMTNQGMGTYYSEAIDDTYQVINMRFGKPEFNSLLGFFSSFYDSSAASLANSGRFGGTFFYDAGKVLGLAASFVFLGGLKLFGILAVAYIGNGIKNIVFSKATKFYYSRPTMALYWLTVSNIVNQIATYKGIFPTFSGDQKLGEEVVFNQQMFEEIQKLMPGVFKDSGFIDVYAIVNRAERQNQKVQKEIAQAIKSASSYDTLTKNVSKIRANVVGQDNGHSLLEILQLWIASEAGGKGEAATQEGVKTETLLRGVSSNPTGNSDSDQKYTAKQLEDDKNISFFEHPVDAIAQRMERFKTYLDAEFSDGSAFATFRVDHTGSVNESFRNSSKESDLAQKMNSMSAQSRAISYTFAGGNVVPGMESIVNAAKDVVKGALSVFSMDGLVTLGGSAFVDIPEHWDNSSASMPSMSYNMRLVSPYGHPISQLINVYIPLAMILAAALPHSAGNQAYASPFLCEVYDQSRCVTRLGMVDSLVITRGVSNLGFTKNKDLLAVDVQFSIKDFSSVVHVPIDTGMLSGPFKTINNVDTSYTDYIAVLGGATLGEQIYAGQKLAIRAKSWAKNMSGNLTSSSQWAGFIRDLPIINNLDLLYPDTGRGN